MALAGSDSGRDVRVRVRVGQTRLTRRGATADLVRPAGAERAGACGPVVLEVPRLAHVTLTIHFIPAQAAGTVVGIDTPEEGHLR